MVELMFPLTMTKIYTKFGDEGKTHLPKGAIIPKTDIIIEFYGALDELNSFLGWAAVEARSCIDAENVVSSLLSIQRELFILPVVVVQNERIMEVEGFISRLEKEIDNLSAKLEPINEFVIPGSNEASARLHIVRCVCRQAERLAFKLSEKMTDSKGIKVCARYLNRLSDLFYVLARSLTE